MEAEDSADYKVILRAILKQAIEDYVKLYHPRMRSKVYLQEAFDSAVGFLFDPEYELQNVWDQEGGNITLVNLIREATGLESFDIKKLQRYVVNEARTYWEKKQLKAIDIPDTVVIDGHAYQVIHCDSQWVDFENQIIFCDRQGSSLAQEEFCKLLVQITVYHQELTINQELTDQIGKGLFRLLRMNSCFVGNP